LKELPGQKQGCEHTHEITTKDGCRGSSYYLKIRTIKKRAEPLDATIKSKRKKKQKTYRKKQTNVHATI
jgi:hypothetical protein